MEGTFVPDEVKAAEAEWEENPDAVDIQDSSQPTPFIDTVTADENLLNPNATSLTGEQSLPQPGEAKVNSDQLLDPNNPVIAQETRFSYQDAKKRLGARLSELHLQLRRGEISREQFENQSVAIRTKLFVDAAKVLDPKASSQGKPPRFSQVLAFADNAKNGELFDRMPYLKNFRPEDIEKVRNEFSESHTRLVDEVVEQVQTKMQQQDISPEAPFPPEFKQEVIRLLAENTPVTNEQLDQITTLDTLKSVVEAQLPFEWVIRSALLQQLKTVEDVAEQSPGSENDTRSQADSNSSIEANYSIQKADKEDNPWITMSELLERDVNKAVEALNITDLLSLVFGVRLPPDSLSRYSPEKLSQKTGKESEVKTLSALEKITSDDQIEAQFFSLFLDLEDGTDLVEAEPKLRSLLTAVQEDPSRIPDLQKQFEKAVDKAEEAFGFNTPLTYEEVDFSSPKVLDLLLQKAQKLSRKN